MNTMEAYMRAQEAKRLGLKHRVFDWHKAAEFIRDHRYEIVWVSAGLKEDMECTSGVIWDDDSVVFPDFTYLQSNWATPIMEVCYKDYGIGIVEIECWQYAEDVPWDENTVWPSSAIDILGGPEACVCVPVYVGARGSSKDKMTTTEQINKMYEKGYITANQAAEMLEELWESK